MAFTVQDDTGSVADANAYIDVAFFAAYHLDRGLTVTGTTAEQQAAIVKATDYMDQRFTFIGEKPNQAQSTDWPRLDAEDSDDNLRTGVPVEVKEACAEYALIAQTSTLNPTPDRDSTGVQVQSREDTVGPITEKREYSGGASFTSPKYPVADQKLMLAGLVVVGRVMRRA